MPPTLTNDKHPIPNRDHDRKDSLATYPSADGSPIHRSSSFWTLPRGVLGATSTLASSMDVGRSEMSCCKQGLRVLLEYGSEGRRREILKREAKWLTETLHPKVVAVEAAFRKYEQALAMETSTHDPNDDNKSDQAAAAAAAKRANEIMRAHRLRVEVNALISPSSSSSSSTSGNHDNNNNNSNQPQRARYSWTMYYAVGSRSSATRLQDHQELVVARGLVDTERELYAAGFWTARRKNLEV